MKKLLLFLVFAVMSVCEANARPYKRYCELVVASTFWNSKICVSVDFGQEQKFAGNDNRLVDENGEIIYFNSPVDAMNFMGKAGWEFEQTYVVKIEDGQTYLHWLFSREVSSDDEAARPLTMSEYKMREKGRR